MLLPSLWPNGARRLVALALPCALAAPAWAQSPPKAEAGIYVCIDERGRRITSDRPIPECAAREQQLLNRDGSLRRVVPPPPTAEERAQREAREKAAAEARAARADAARRDRNLLARYPDEAAHGRAREAALSQVRVSMRATEDRLAKLAAESKPLQDEAEFYQGKPLPPRLKAAIEANAAAIQAQHGASANQQAEMARINRLYDAELEHLRRLWAGMPPGAAAEAAASGPARRR